MSENVYDKARAVLREQGWAKHTPVSTAPVDHSGPACLHLALCVAQGIQGTYDTPASRTLADIVNAEFPERNESSRCFYAFNDHPDTTREDVDLVLDKAARIWDEQVQP